ncbi:MAG: DUF4445 domain-containing protein, partial [Armatimonadetes bacterium]|nr:DUF4445 domain-containing protein [Armatimonadota bacterium]
VVRFAEVVQSGNHELTLVLEDDRLIGVEPGDTRGKILGVAVDIGTTTIALYLMDLEQGKILASSASTNSQSAYGADVMSRIGYSMEQREGRELLTRLVREDVSKLARAACRQVGEKPEFIYRWSVVGNTTMQHFFLGLDPTPLGVLPYLPLVSGAVEFAPEAFGLPGASCARGVFLPTIAGHVGADTTGVALAARLHTCNSLTLAIDLGTNGEIVLAEPGRMICCSTAAGPAFEGARIQMGMRAVPGAIDRFWISDEEEVNFHVIGDNLPPRGICGSGLMDIASELLRCGVIDSSGRILPAPEQKGKLSRKLTDRLFQGKHGHWNFVIDEYQLEGRTHRIIFTQADVRELQLAVGAIATGIKLLLKKVDRCPEEIEQVLLTGAFGHYLNPASAIGIGLIRGLKLDRIHSVGNAAGLGARLALVSTEELRTAIRIAERMEFVELAATPNWQEEFAESMFFPKPEETF